MNEELSHKDFEKQLKDSADNFMPEPSDKVWAGINEQLHPNRRVYAWWWAAGILLLLALGIYMLQRPGFSPVKQPARTVVNSPASSGTTPGNVTPSQPGQEGDIAPVPGRESPAGSPASHVFKNQTANKGTGRKMPAIQHKSSNSSLRPIVRRQQEELAGLPVLPHLQPDFSPAFNLSFVKYTPSFSDSFTADNERRLTSLQQDTPDFAKKKVQAGLRNPPKRKPVLEISFTPGIGYRALKIASPQAMMADPTMGAQLAFTLPSYRASNDVGIQQHPDYGWTAAAQIMLPLGKQWFIQSGISLAKTGYSILAYSTYPATIRNNGLTAFADRSTNSYYTVSPVGAAALKLSYVHNRYLATEIPVLIGRQFGNPHKVSFSVGAGVGIFYLVASDPVIYSPDSKRYFTDKKYLHPFNGNLHLETSINIPLNHKFQISLGPSLQYQIFSSYKNYPQVKEHPYLLGIKTGLQLR